MENKYYSLLNEQYILKMRCKLSLMEQMHLTAEDRRWWINRYKEDVEEEKKQSKH